ncbi:MAG: hypothetical protein OXC38_07550, partial [Gammaproteobacteria bacterium]|nr:hypothetical protein [Gammaproteobacteria bacterium]
QAVSPATNSDFTQAGTTLTIAAGATTSTGTVTITAVDNDGDAPDKTVTVSGTASGGGVSSPVDQTLTIRDDDGTSTVSLALSPASITENGGISTVTANLPRALSVAVAVTVSTQAVSPATNSDFTQAGTTLTIAAGATTSTGTVTLTAVDNAVSAADKMVTVSGTASGGGVSSPVDQTLTIRDDDARGVALTPTSLAVREGETETYTLVLTSEPSQPVRIAVESSNPLLVKASPVDLTFTASNWNREQTVTVMALAAGSAELTHQVTSTGDYASVIASPVRVTVHSLLGSVNDELLPRITQAMMSSTLSAISRRMDMANPNVDSEGPHTFGGQASLEQALASLATATKGTTSLNLRRALGGKEFVLPFNAAAGETQSAAEVWGRGDYRSLEGGDDRPVRWDGDLASVHAGVDWEVRPGLLAGVVVSWSDGKFDYQNRGDRREGTYDSELTSVHPYVSWMSFENALQAWATIGYGRGEIEISDGNGKHSSDTRLRTAAVGASAVLASEHNQIMFGTSTLRIKAEGNVTEIEAYGGDGIEPLTADVERIRVVLEGRHVCERGPGEWLIPWVEVGARHDGGDGLTGTGMEVGTGVRYSNAAKDLTVEGEARYLINHSDDYGEWGFHGEIRIDPGDGRGLSFGLAPSLGQHPRGLASLWARDGPGILPADERKSVDGRLDVQIEYGLPAVEGRGLLTPYAHLSLAGGGGDFRIGSRLELGPTFSLNVEGGRFGEVDGSSDLGIGFFIQVLV